MYYSLLLIGVAQLATICSVSAAESGKDEANISNQLPLSKRGIEYTPFNIFFVERAHGNKFAGSSSPGQTSPKPATETAPDTGADNSPEIPPEAPKDSQIPESAQAPETAQTPETAQAPESAKAPESAPAVSSSNPIAEVSSIQESSKNSGNFEDSNGSEFPAPEISSTAEITKTPASKVNENENQNAEATSTQVNTFILKSGQPQSAAQSHSPVSSNLAVSGPILTSEPSPPFSSIVASDPAEMEPSGSESMIIGRPNPGEEVNSGPHMQANTSLVMNGAFYVMQEGQDRGIAQTNVPKQAFDSKNTAKTAPSPENVKEITDALSLSPKVNKLSQEETSTVTTTSTKYIHGVQRTRTELRKVTTTVCEESAPCAHTDMNMESTRPQMNEIIQVEQIKPPVTVQEDLEGSKFMSSQTSDITTTLTSTITIKKLRTYDSTTVSETCFTMNEKDHTKTIWSAETSQALGNVTRPQSFSVYEGRARDLALDMVLGSICAAVIFFV